MPLVKCYGFNTLNTLRISSISHKVAFLLPFELELDYRDLNSFNLITKLAICFVEYVKFFKIQHLLEKVQVVS